MRRAGRILAGRMPADFVLCLRTDRADRRTRRNDPIDVWDSELRAAIQISGAIAFAGGVRAPPAPQPAVKMKLL
ncbi:hypothetical protein BRAS3843_2460006 [Bradyrhizobium sp. STM 3843]|nr:hypothetical protein BRAS3843_2460006 [Bradyrhizobium sp. STM 3843]